MSPERILALRQRLGWSQSELARVLWVDAQTVYRWESGKARPYPRHETLLAELEEGFRDRDATQEAPQASPRR